jgi:hypothetical protein
MYFVVISLIKPEESQVFNNNYVSYECVVPALIHFLTYAGPSQ